MNIYGLNKTTLLDYPEHLAAVIFLGNCNFRCPFCHNKSLVTELPSSKPLLESDILGFLKKRKDILEGVCITGGEPTLSKELPSFMEKIKNMGYLIKLDTNGYEPDRLKDLCNHGLVDYVAMDIKNSKKKYMETSGLNSLDLNKIEDSINFLVNGSIDYEFRTTIVKELHTKEDLYEIGQWIHNCKSYYLQNYKETEGVIYPGFTSYSKNELLAFQKLLLPFIPSTILRGVD
ncbi:MAG: anaerobic ribonucleoside-triphosphate reductase activating protein [Clostridiales bacterium]|nr:anaerobic ribonucleoside-triphosphate reductase activating protein [Clostridiales bacterium]